jgi:hypothetical protein
VGCERFVRSGDEKLRYVFAILTLSLAVVIFLAAADDHAWREYNLHIWSMWSSKEYVLETFSFMSPCIIYVITVLVYYKFIITYTGAIAAWSFVGFLAASFCCVRLLEANPSDWTSHLLWVYILFLSYAWWDGVMLLYLLPRQSDQQRASADEKEIYAITAMINWPTLLALLLMWFFVRYIESHQLARPVGTYVNGIIAFHLVFASCVAAFNTDPRPLFRD